MTTRRTTRQGTPTRRRERAGGGRGALTRTTIVAAAIELVDNDGLNALSMRRLATVLGVEAMSLYHHVNGREDLLEAMVSELVEQVRVNASEAIGDVDGWQGYLHLLAHRMRSMATTHPKLFPLAVTRPPAAPWLRPPLRSLAMVEDFLEAMTGRGMTDEGAVAAYKTFASFLLGNLLLEVAVMGAETSPPEEALDEGDADVPNEDQEESVDDYPLVRRLQPRLEVTDADAEFQDALEALLERLDKSLSQ